MVNCTTVGLVADVTVAAADGVTSTPQLPSELRSISRSTAPLLMQTVDGTVSITKWVMVTRPDWQPFGTVVVGGPVAVGRAPMPGARVAMAVPVSCAY